MTLTAKIMIAISVVWFGFWLYVFWPLWNPGATQAFIFSLFPFALGWIIRLGIYLFFKKNNNLELEKPIVINIAAFKDPIRLSMWTKILHILQIFNLILLFSLECHSYLLHPQKPTPFQVSLVFFCALAFFAILLMVIVMQSLWIYRMQSNSHQLGISKLSYSPGEAVFWTFIPFGVYYVIREIYKANWFLGNQWKKQSTPLLIKLWSPFFWLCTFPCIFFYTRNAAPPLGGMLFDLNIIVNEILFILIINQISKKQVANYQQLKSLDPTVAGAAYP